MTSRNKTIKIIILEELIINQKEEDLLIKIIKINLEKEDLTQIIIIEITEL